MEARTIARALRLAQRNDLGWKGMFEGRSIWVRCIGIRARRVPTVFPIEGSVILAGLAGGLDPSLAVGQLIIDSQSHPLPDLSLIPAARCRVGPICTADRVMNTVEEKRALYEKTGALAVEMESAFVRDRLKNSGTAPPPFLHIRGISDTSEDAVDPAVVGFIDDLGNPKPFALATTLFKRPMVIPTLQRLGANSKLAARNVAAATAAILKSGWPEKI